jgi:succinyl-diaminopimelate desuccinylase
MEHPNDSQAFLSDVLSLIRLDTSNGPGNETIAAEWLEKRVAGFGMEAQISEISSGRSNCLASFDFGPGPTLVLCTHLDVVPGPIELFSPTIDNGRLYGRGSCDAKGALAAMVAAAERACLEPAKFSGKLIIAAVADEEVGASGAKYLLSNGFKADGIVIGEPTLNLALFQSRGVVRSKITFMGRSGHASTSSNSFNAISAAAKTVNALTKYSETLAAKDEGTCSVTMINGGSAVNVIPDRCEIVLDRRVPPWMSLADAEAELDNVVRECLSRDEVTWSRAQAGASINSLTTDGNSAFIKKLSMIPSIKFGGTFPAVTDAPHFADQGIPVVILGPGSIEQAHTGDEWVDLRQLMDSREIYFDIVVEFLTPASE